MRAILACAAILLSTAASAKDLTVPTSFAQLDQRIAVLQQEARSAACDAKDRVCTMGKLAFLQSAAELARKYPCSTDACGAQKKARIEAADAAVEALKRDFEAQRLGPLTVRDGTPPTNEVFLSHARRSQDDLAASRCSLERPICVAGTLGVLTEVDQSLRVVMVRCMPLSDPDTRQKCMAPVGKRLMEQDAASTKTLLAITDKYGWPDALHWGVQTEENAWLLAQHADANNEAQTRFFDLMTAAFNKGWVTGKYYAYLVDRRAIHEKKPQIYGTQSRCTGEGAERKAEALPIADVEHVDLRRAEAGLKLLQAYLDGLNKRCRGEVLNQPNQ